MKKLYMILATALITVANTNAQIIINEIYGGGGNSGTTLKNDFVELVNRGSTNITLSGAYLQYASVNGKFSTSNIISLPTFTLMPGQYYLVKMAGGGGGTTDLPTPDFTPDSKIAFNMSATGGKLALTSNDIIVTADNNPNVIDFVGWGSADMYEASPAPATTANTSVSRNAMHDDTNNNKADFSVGSPTPTNSRNNVTPVTLIAFNVQQAGDGASLTWQVAQEINVRQYVIEYSTDGIYWIVAGMVAAKANTGNAFSYSYTAPLPAFGITYYRLKMDDEDGLYAYSEVKSMLVNNFAASIYPNPVKNILNIVTNEKNLRVEIFSLAGTKVFSSVLAGKSINFTRLPTGIYLVKLYTNNNAEKVFKIRKE